MEKHSPARNTAALDAHRLQRVALGWAASLAHPGGNLTGMSTNNYQLTGKRIEPLKKLLPKLTRVPPHLV